MSVQGLYNGQTRLDIIGPQPDITTLVIRLTNSTKQLLTLPLGFSTLSRHFHKSFRLKEKFGQLVLLGFDVTTFTPAAYQRRSLQRPSKEI